MLSGVTTNGSFLIFFIFITNSGNYVVKLGSNLVSPNAMPQM